MLSMLDDNFSRRYFEIFFLFSQKIDFDISSKLSPMENGDSLQEMSKSVFWWWGGVGQGDKKYS